MAIFNPLASLALVLLFSVSLVNSQDAQEQQQQSTPSVIRTTLKFDVTTAGNLTNSTLGNATVSNSNGTDTGNDTGAGEEEASSSYNLAVSPGGIVIDSFLFEQKVRN